MNIKYLLLNIFLVVSLFFLVGGGYYFIIGCVLYAMYIALSCVLYPDCAIGAWFGKQAMYLWLFLLFYFVTSSFSITGVVSLFVRLSPLLLFIQYKRICNRHPLLVPQSKWLILAIMAILVFYCYKSFMLLVENPMALRELVSSDKDDSVIVGGGFALPYALSIFIPFLVERCRLGIFPNKFTQVFVYVFIVVGTLMVVYSLYMTAIIILVFGCVWALMRHKSVRAKIFYISALSVLLVLFYGYIDTLLYAISGDDTQVLMLRFEEITSILSGNDISQATDFYSRILLTLSSIMVFFQNPVIGVGYKANYNSYALEDLGVGQHAQWFDIFAIYGLVALLLIIYFAKVSSNKDVKSSNNISLILFIVVGFLNPTFLFPILLVTYFLSPMINICWKK